MFFVFFLCFEASEKNVFFTGENFFSFVEPSEKGFYTGETFFFLVSSRVKFFFFPWVYIFFSCAETSKKPFLSYLVNRSENDAHYFAVQPHGKLFRAFVG